MTLLNRNITNIQFCILKRTFNSTSYWEYNYQSMLILKLVYVCKGGPRVGCWYRYKSKKSTATGNFGLKSTLTTWRYRRQRYILRLPNLGGNAISHELFALTRVKQFVTRVHTLFSHTLIWHSPKIVGETCYTGLHRTRYVFSIYIPQVWPLYTLFLSVLIDAEWNLTTERKHCNVDIYVECYQWAGSLC